MKRQRRQRGGGIIEGFLPHSKHTYDTIRAQRHQVTIDRMMDARIWGAVWFQHNASQKEAHGDYDGAIADYTKTIELNPFSAYAHVERAGIYCALDDQESAIEDYSKAIELLTKEVEHRDDIDLDIPVPDTYHWKGFRWGLAQFTEAIEDDPEDANAYKARGDVHFLIGNYDEAIADYSKAIELNPDDKDAYRSRGTAYVAKGDETIALADLEKAESFLGDDEDDNG